MRLYFPIAKVDADRQEVWGYASTEARDEQGEIVKREALQAALGDYMKFANIREMHQMSAVGVAKEANVDDNGLYIGAKIIDPIAWQKVVEGVYKGFSIGGRVTQRDPQDYKTITGLVLNEISVVDRPANPQAVFDYWKASSEAPAEPVLRSGFWFCGNPLHNHNVKSAASICMRKATSETQMAEPFNASLQIWTCGVPEHRHLAKADAQKCIGAQKEDAGQAVATPAAVAKGADEPEDGSNRYGDVAYADPGYQEDGKERYPIDTQEHIRAAWSYINHPNNATRYSAENLKRVKNRIIVAWKRKIDKHGPPSADDNEKVADNAISKGWWDVGRVAHMILDLDWLQHQLEIEAAMEGDDSPHPAKLQSIISELCAFLNALVAEETAEVIAGNEISPGAMTSTPMALAAYGDWIKALDHLLERAKTSGKPTILAGPGVTNYEKFKADLEAAMGTPNLIGKAGARHSESDQSTLDLGYHACMMAAGMDSMPGDKRDCMKAAADSFKAAGAMANEHGAPTVTPPAPEYHGQNATQDTRDNAETIAPSPTPPSSEYHGQNATQDTRDNAGHATPQVDAGASGSGCGIDHLTTGAIILDLAKRMHGGHQLLMDVAHACCSKVSDGLTCGAAKALRDALDEAVVSKMGARHSAVTMGHLHAAHGHLMGAGVQCGKAANPIPGGQPTAPGEEEGGGTANSAAGKTAKAGDLVKSLIGNLTATAVENVIKSLQPQLDQLAKRVEEIAKEPLPPLAARSEAAVAKLLAEQGLQPVDKIVGGDDPAPCAPSIEQMADAFAKMSNEDQTLLLIRAAQKRPMVAPGSGTHLPS